IGPLLDDLTESLPALLGRLPDPPAVLYPLPAIFCFQEFLVPDLRLAARFLDHDDDVGNGSADLACDAVEGRVDGRGALLLPAPRPLHALSREGDNAKTAAGQIPGRRPR